MEYENVEEQAKYEEACKRVKQIANAIKAIRIKYYPNKKINEQDSTKFELLMKQMDTIAQKYGLEGLKKELTDDINATFDITKKILEELKNRIINNPEDRENVIQEILKKAIGANIAEVEAVSRGKLKKALVCRKVGKKCEELLDRQADIKYIRGIGRRVKENLMWTKDERNRENFEFLGELKGIYKNENSMNRYYFMEEIKGVTNRNSDRRAIFSETEQGKIEPRETINEEEPLIS